MNATTGGQAGDVLGAMQDAFVILVNNSQFRYHAAVAGRLQDARATVSALIADKARLEARLALAEQREETERSIKLHERRELTARAEQAEAQNASLRADVDLLRTALREAVGDDAGEWETGDGWSIGDILAPALAGDMERARFRLEAYRAEREIAERAHDEEDDAALHPTAPSDKQGDEREEWVPPFQSSLSRDFSGV